MPTKKKTTSGPKATLMKKNLAQLRAQAKKLKIKGFSTKKKEALVNSIMMAQARKKKSSTPKKSMAAGGKRMMKKRGAKPNRVMRRPVNVVKPIPKMRKPMLSEYNGWSNYETWLVNLHYDTLFYEIAEESSGIEAYDLAQIMSDIVNEQVFDIIGDEYFVNDMANAFLAQVNYREIAEIVLDEL